MSHDTEPTNREHNLDQILAEYLNALDAGQTPAPGSLQARYPHLSREIEEFLADHERVEQWTRELRALRPAAATMTEDPTLPPSGGLQTWHASPGEATPAAPQGAPRPERFGDYELLQEIARGGMGVVYKARQVSLNRVVALKMILAGQLASAEDVRRFRSEAEAAANLNHPNIVPIHEVGEYRGQQFFTMKLIEGGSLAQWNAARALGPQVERDEQRVRARLVASVARAVHHAHQHGILHRDLKPGNILMDGRGEPHVTDFGLAKRVRESAEESLAGAPTLTQTGVIVGTPSYMPPEQAQASKSLTTAADTYSLGAILYELLAGRPPFRGETPMDTIMQLLSVEVTRPSQLNPRVDRDLETMCLKCLEKEPQRRYASAQALAEDLERWEAGEPIQARRASRWERVRKWARRRPAAAGLLAVSGGSLAALLVLLAFLWQNLALRAQAVESLEQAETQIKTKKTELQRLEEIAKEERQKAAAAQETANRVLYAADVQYAKAAWESDDVPRMIRYLKDHLPKKDHKDYRAFEWHYLWRLAHASHIDIRAHLPIPDPESPKVEPFQPIVLAMAPDGKTFASTSQDRQLKLWDTASGKEIRSWQVPKGVVSLGYTGDGKRLVLVTASPGEKGLNNLLKLMPEAMEGKLPPTLDYLKLVQVMHEVDVDSPKPPRQSAFDVQKLAAPVQILLAGDAMGPMMNGFVPLERKRVFMPLCFALSPDRHLLALAGLVTEKSDDPAIAVKQATGILLWDLKAGKEKAFWPTEGGFIVSLTFAPDGQTVSSAGMDRAIRQWDVAAGKELPHFRNPTGFIASLAYAGKDRLVSGSFDGTVKVWDLTRRELQASFKGHQNSVTSAVLSPDGHHLVSASVDGTIKIWDGRRTPGPERFDVEGPVQALALSGDAQTVMTFGKDTLYHYGMNGKEQARYTIPGPAFRNRAAFSADGRYLAVMGDAKDRSVKVFETGDGRLLWSLKLDNTFGRLAFSRDGKRLAVTGGVDKADEIKVFDLADGKELLTVTETEGIVSVLAFSPDGQSLACGVIGKESKRIKLWDLGQKKARISWDEEIRFLASLAFSPDGEMLAINSGNKIVVRDVRTGKERFSNPTHMERIVGLEFTPDGSRLVSAEYSMDRGRGSIVNFWDTSTGRLVMTLEGSAAGISQLRLSPDGHRLVGVFVDEGLFFGPQGKKTEVRVWNGTPTP